MSHTPAWTLLASALLTVPCVAQTPTKQPEAANIVGMYLDLPPAPRNLHEYAVQEIQQACKKGDTNALEYDFQWTNRHPALEQSVTVDCKGRMTLHNITLKEALRWVLAEEARGNKR